MATTTGSVLLRSGSSIGVTDIETGKLYGPPLGVTRIALVPSSIDHSGVTDVTDDLQTFIDSQPDGTLIVFVLNGRYFCNLTLNVWGRRNLLFDLNGATIFSKQKFPLQYPLTNVTIGALGDTGPYTVQGWPSTTIAAASNGVTLPHGTIAVATTAGFDNAGTFVIVGPTGAGLNTIVKYMGRSGTTFTGCTLGSGTLATGQIVRTNKQAMWVQPGTLPTLGGYNNNQVGDDNVSKPGQDNIPIITFIRNPDKGNGFRIAQIASKSFIPCVPGTGLDVIIQGPNNSLARFDVRSSDAGVRCQNIKFRNGHLLGTNKGSTAADGTVIPPGSYDAKVEGQHGINVLGVDGIEIGPNLEIGWVWGDGVNCTVDKPAGVGTHLDPRPPGLAGGNAVRNLYIHDIEIHHNGRQMTTLSGIINALIEHNDYLDGPRSGVDFEVPTSSCALNVTIRFNTMSPSFSFVNPASYPVGSNVYFENLMVDGNLVNSQTFIANNTLDSGLPNLRWKHFTFKNNVDTGNTPFGRKTPPCVVEFKNVDHILMVGNVQSLQFPNPGGPIFFVLTDSCADVQVHDNILDCGPQWAISTNYSIGDCVTHGQNGWLCRADHFSRVTTEPGVGATWTTTWRSLQLNEGDFPFGFVEIDSGSSLSAAGVSVASGRASALLISGSRLSAAGSAQPTGVALFSSGDQLFAHGSVIHSVSALITSGSILAARGTSVLFDDTIAENEFRAGRAALRGRGWDMSPWDSDGWGGLS